MNQAYLFYAQAANSSMKNLSHHDLIVKLMTIRFMTSKRHPMPNTASAITEMKNQWLASQVDVEFPTPESLKGHELYQARGSERETHLLDLSELSLDEFSEQDVFVADFHRMTVMFALQQAKQWKSQQDREWIVEFFTQIIYSAPCQLIVAFKGNQPVGAALVTTHQGAALISDVAVEPEYKRHDLIAAIVSKLELNQCDAVYVEHSAH